MEIDLAPLYVLTGAPGAGKSTLLPELVRASRSSHGIVVIDIDELLDDAGALLGVPIAVSDAEPIWPAYNRMWRQIIDLPRRVGHPVLFLCPLVPAEFEGATDWALLDCDDETRAARLLDRGWSPEQIREAARDARNYRQIISTTFATDAASPSQVTERVLRWTESGSRFTP